MDGFVGLVREGIWMVEEGNGEMGSGRGIIGRIGRINHLKVLVSVVNYTYTRRIKDRFKLREFHPMFSSVWLESQAP
jgi:hypothetical protein